MLWYQKLGLTYPLFQGGMAWASNPELVAAVSNAGGLGIIGSGGRSASELRDLIIQTRRLTSHPFGVNLMLLDQNIAPLVNVVCQENIPLVTTGAGNPGHFLSHLIAHHIKVFPVVPSLKIAEKMLKLPISGLIAEGIEAGGHVGKESTISLISQIVPISHVPVLAAGGIYAFSNFKAHIELGADGVQVGTAFLAAQECCISLNYKRLLCECGPFDTVLAQNKAGHQTRILKISDTHFSNRSLKAAVITGNLAKGSFMAGTAAEHITKIESAEHILKRIVGEESQVKH